ncbi:probable disease resistance protein At4g27220 [Vigna umbellata]|uniref:probable disease resistance protein At4g27220 n=1 Tax=Vigna umbellata TaxID=87088 RepID=UPI001F5F5CBB|nr:probable disease resistance protein At4g27220 [Vigna umbellata]
MKDSLNQFGCFNFHVPQGEMYLAEQSQKKIQYLTEEIQEHKKWKPLVLSNEYFGREFEKNVEKLWKLMRDDRVFIIGIHGMGGVGKTFLANYMQNEIKRIKTFKDVLWVTVSHYFTIFKLQERIAKIIKVESFTQTMRGKEQCDDPDNDSHNDFDNDDDDDEDYCDDYEEDWMLFLLKLKSYGTPLTLSPQMRNIARYVVKKCYGLPLGISMMARTMKGKTDIHWWRHVLNKFDKLEMGVDMEEKVFTVLRRSYDNLSGKDLQKCFLYVALLPNSMFRNCLIGKLVNTELLDGNKSVEEIFDETNVIVDELINHSLLEAKEARVPSSVEVLSMHGLVRKMALNILRESVSKMMIKCNGNMPDTQKWAIDLEVVSLARNKIKTIPEGTSPNCPRLLTLLLFENYITHIPECFFTHMNALTTLDLSENFFLRCLPHSLSNLRSLTSLMLNECNKLEDIPPLGELQSLLRLEISNCSIRAPPEGLENLVNLKWLDLSMNKNLKLVTGSFLPSLTKIRYLDLSGCIGGIGVEDVKEMTMLECFAGTFVDHDNFDNYVEEILNSTNGPQTYFIHMDHGSKMSLYSESCLSTFNGRIISFRNCKEVLYVLPLNIMKLLVYCNDYWV